MAKKYGLPYQGSKSKLAERIVALLPPATHLYDVFAGGCAVTHAAMLSGKFKEVRANDITDSVKLFEDALNGDIAKYEPERFRNREDFFAERDSNPFVRLVYSFGNDQRTYLYGCNIETYKKAVHEMLYAPTVNERMLKFKAVIRELEKLGVISTPHRFMKDNQAEEAKQRIGSVSMNDCRPMSVQNKSKELRNEINGF